MKVKEKRHKIEDRDEFTDQQKSAIAAKSDNCCAWCGKKVYFGYGATVDHFIPIKKGGTNDFDNLIMMCHDCNQKKGSRILSVNIGGMYLKDSAYQSLERYFSQYLNSFDYISRGNLLACDVYGLYILPEVVADAGERVQRRGKELNIGKHRTMYQLKRAYPEDEQKITEYYLKYLKKYDQLDSEKYAIENIKFWMRFGSIYYIERNNQIFVIAAITVNVNGYISINLFSYYSNVMAQTVTRGIVSCITDSIMEENNLFYLPISANMLKKDELCKRILNLNKSIVINDRLVCENFFTFADKAHENSCYQDENSDEFKQGVEDFKQFISRFKNPEDSIRLYLYQNDLQDMNWMASEILERNVFDEDMYVKVACKNLHVKA